MDSDKMTEETKSKGCANCGHKKKYHGKVNYLVNGKGENCKILLNDGKPCLCKKFVPQNNSLPFHKSDSFMNNHKTGDTSK